MAKRFGRTNEETWSRMEVRTEVVKKSYKKYSGRVMFPSTHDIIKDSIYEEACFIVLEKLLKSNNHVLITTKPSYPIIQKINKNFSDFRDNIQFRFTITSKDDNLLKFWEPNAPRFKERLRSLKYSFKNDFKTSVSIEPFLDYDPENLFNMVFPYTTESIWLGIMNYIPRNHLKKDEIPFYANIRQNYTHDHIQAIYNKFRDYPKIRFKDTIRKKIGIN